MLKGAYFALPCICLIGLSGCAVKLKQATSAWDHPKPNAIRLAKKWGPPSRLAETVSTVQIKRSPEASLPGDKWLIQPPSLNQPGNNSHPVVGSIVEIASQFLGTPYVYGGESPSEGFDCSGLVQYVYALKGISLKRLANEQFLQGRAILNNELQPGDLVFFSSTGQIVDHVGIYAGDRLFIHAPRTGRSVSYDSLDSSWFSSRFQGARRIAGG